MRLYKDKEGREYVLSAEESKLLEQRCYELGISISQGLMRGVHRSEEEQPKNLRDEFALAVLPLLLGIKGHFWCFDPGVAPDESKQNRADVARDAYIMADEMMKARGGYE